MNDEKLKALRTELHEIYKRFAEGRELPQDKKRADQIASEIHDIANEAYGRVAE